MAWLFSNGGLSDSQRTRNQAHRTPSPDRRRTCIGGRTYPLIDRTSQIRGFSPEGYVTRYKRAVINRRPRARAVLRPLTGSNGTGCSCFLWACSEMIVKNEMPPQAIARVPRGAPAVREPPRVDQRTGAVPADRVQCSTACNPGRTRFNSAIPSGVTAVR